MEDLDKRYQTLIILWFALVMSIVMFFVLALVAAPESEAQTDSATARIISFVFMGVGTFVVVLSFLIKRRILERSVEQQDPSLVQKALVIACAMCEVAALLGLVDRFTIHNRYYYLLFILALVGELFHFPLRSQLLAATYKSEMRQHS